MFFISHLKKWISEYVTTRGLRITRLPLATYFTNYKIDCILDVGANTGQFAMEARRLGYRGRIESFEPIPGVLESLRARAARDSLWSVHPYALGDVASTSAIHVLSHSPSSSFLQPTEILNDTKFDVVTSQNVEVRRLDDVYETIRGNAENTYLKIDTQGYERHVIEGGKNSLKHIRIVQMELALVPNYHGEALMEEMIATMRRLQFTPWWIMDGYRNSKTLQLYQADVFFVREDVTQSQ